MAFAMLELQRRNFILLCHCKINKSIDIDYKEPSENAQNETKELLQ